MAQRFDRLSQLLGPEALARLARSSVLVTGLGGVGGTCAEALARSGVGRIGVIDAESVELSNINRQALAFESTLGRPKVEVFAERARDINPEIQVDCHALYLNRDSAERVDVTSYDLVADCIDSLIPKLNLIVRCLETSTPIVSSTGAGFRIRPEDVRVGSIWQTRNDPLAHRMRKKLRQWGHGAHDFPVVYSLELRPPEQRQAETIGSAVTVTGVFGLMLASLALRRLTKEAPGE